MVVKFRTRQPTCPDDTMIQRPIRMLMRTATAKGDTQESGLDFGVSPKINAGDGIRLEFPTGFFECFAPHGINETLGFFEMAGRIVDHQPAADLFLNQQKAPFAFSDGSDGDVGCPSHGQNLTLRAEGGKPQSLKRLTGSQPEATEFRFRFGLFPDIIEVAQAIARFGGNIGIRETFIATGKRAV